VDDRPGRGSLPVTGDDQQDAGCEHADVTEISTVEFAAFYASEMRPVVRHVIRAVPGADVHRATDAAQAAFIQAYQTWSTIRHPRAWVRTVAVREYRRARALEREVLTSLLPDQPTAAADDGLEDRALARAALEAFSKLPPRQREVMSWCRDEFTPAEIARELGIDAAAVRQSIAKARRNLRKLVGTWRDL
jgi:RNA polymerase sigma factor (sigma-70 family)